MKATLTPPLPTLTEDLLFSEAALIQNVLNSVLLKIIISGNNQWHGSRKSEEITQR